MSKPWTSTPSQHEEGVVTSSIGWILFGLIVGVLATLFMPGPDPGGMIMTILLGIAGALLGGLIGRVLGWYGEGDPVGFIMALVGAILILVVRRHIIAGPARIESPKKMGSLPHRVQSKVQALPGIVNHLSERGR